MLLPPFKIVCMNRRQWIVSFAVFLASGEERKRSYQQTHASAAQGPGQTSRTPFGVRRRAAEVTLLT